MCFSKIFLERQHRRCNSSPLPTNPVHSGSKHRTLCIRAWLLIFCRHIMNQRGKKQAKIKVNSGIRKGGRLLIFSYTKLLQQCGLTPINITDKWWKHWSSWFGWLIHTCSGKGSLPCAFGPLDVLQEDSCCSVLETLWKNWVSRVILHWIPVDYSKSLPFSGMGSVSMVKVNLKSGALKTELTEVPWRHVAAVY